MIDSLMHKSLMHKSKGHGVLIFEAIGPSAATKFGYRRIRQSHLHRDSGPGRHGGPGRPGATVGISQIDFGCEIDSLLNISASVVQNSLSVL